MHTLTWTHTRKGTPMVVRGSWQQLWLRALLIRHARPGHPMLLDGRPI